MSSIFHLAFPVHDFDEAAHFYCDLLGCQKGRQSKNAMILALDGHQLVAHRVDGVNTPQDSIYPRHFGLIFQEKKSFDDFVERLMHASVPFEVPLKIRFEDTSLEHHSFFLKDPSNNLLEFKYYSNPDAIFGETDYHRIGETKS